MDFRDRRGLKDVAGNAIANASYDPKKLVFVYVGVTAAVMLLVTIANYILQSQIAGTGGLGGLAMRSLLETAIQVLQLAANLLLPFWTFGYMHCMLRLSRGQHFGLDGLLEGFRNFGPVLRLTLLRSGYFVMLAFLCVYPSMVIFLWTPLSAPFQAIIEPFAAQGAMDLVLDDATLAAATEALTPMLLIYGILFALIAGPKFYSYRMADYCLMDDPKAGALSAIRHSNAMLHKNRLELLKLDLHFWWFYLLDGLAMALCYGDALLALMGITLPVSAEVSYFLFYVLYLVVQLGLYVWARNRVEATYCVGYNCLRRDLDDKIRQIMAQNQQL